ncbi:hypothetical protein KIW84_014122 [Lathyrus oleraceus]|uniref:Uncharacterized protein n=1 Tax=Pisum sativum TaxID=3888 RepID=A0A9D5GYX2_PEA|nr:hypothetical protein KIW84_014122 [Pisum sativum]
MSVLLETMIGMHAENGLLSHGLCESNAVIEPQMSFAFHYSWSDPCLDYAINTLMGVLSLVGNSVDEGPSSVPEIDIQKSTFDTVTGSSRNSQNNSVDNGPTTVP